MSRPPDIETRPATCPPTSPPNVISITDGQIFLTSDLFKLKAYVSHQ